jgi:integrase
MEKSETFLKPAQIQQMRDAAYEGRHGLRDDAIIILLYDTGLRRMELSDTNRDMLDLDDEILRIPPRIQKQHPNGTAPRATSFELDQSGRLGTVRTLRAYLDSIDVDPNAIFPSQQSDRMTPRSINNVVKRAAERAEINPHSYDGQSDGDDVSAHTLRHSVAYRMLRVEDGNTLYDVRNRLRHSSIKTTEDYYDHFDTV